MIVTIDDKSMPLIKKMLEEQNKEAVRIKKCGVG
jgi:hypothetical protein